MNTKKTFLKIIIPVVILAAGIAAMLALFSSSTEPKKEIKTNPGILARTIEVSIQDKTITVNSTGTVRASKEVSIIPQVSGRVTYISPSLVVGGHFKKDDVLFEIEDIDYVLALEQANAARAKAEYELATIEGRARIARTEWDQLKNDNQEEPNPLVLYRPQLANAKAALSSADAAVRQAKLALERTIVKAPFNSRVTSESIDIGQYVISGNKACILTGTDTAGIYVPLPAAELYWINVPLHGKELNGPDATVSVNIAGQSYKWQGHVLRSTGEVDPKSRMMQLVIEISDPYGLSAKNKTVRPALAIGTFVNVAIKGRTLKDIFIIPRTAFRDNSTVWLMGKDSKLYIKNVVAVRTEKQDVIISKGLNNGDKIILTNISGAADGMKLRTVK